MNAKKQFAPSTALIHEGPTMRTFLIAVVFIAIAVSISAQAQESRSLEVDLVNSKLNGKHIFSLSLDEATDMLGRPTETSTRLGNTILDYHKYGVVLTFSRKNDELICRNLGIYFVKDWMTRWRGKSFAPIDTATFEGKLSKGVNGTWKMKLFFAEFSELGPKDMAQDAELQKKYKEVLEQVEKGRALGVKPSDGLLRAWSASVHRVVVEKPKITVQYDPATQFVDSIHLNSPSED